MEGLVVISNLWFATLKSFNLDVLIAGAFIDITYRSHCCFLLDSAYSVFHQELSPYSQITIRVGYLNSTRLCKQGDYPHLGSPHRT